MQRIPQDRVSIIASRPRREFHGDRNSTIEVDTNLTYNWIQKFWRKFGREQGDCWRLFGEFESAINQFGYSFTTMESILPSNLLEPYLISMSNVPDVVPEA